MNGHALTLRTTRPNMTRQTPRRRCLGVVTAHPMRAGRLRYRLAPALLLGLVVLAAPAAVEAQDFDQTDTFNSESGNPGCADTIFGNWTSQNGSDGTDGLVHR